MQAEGGSAPAPIETYWHGYRFRSRLEARWAVFFSVFRFGELKDQSNKSWYHGGHRLFCNPDDKLSEKNCSSEYKQAVYASRCARFEAS